MRHSFLLSVITLTTTCFVFYGCLKDSENFTPNDQVGNISLLLNKLSSYDHSLVINPATENKIITKGNQIITIPANTLVYADGKIAEGNVVMNYTIRLNRSLDIIKQRETKMGGKVVKALFNVDISFKQGEQNLMVNPNEKGINFKIPYGSKDELSNININFWDKDQWVQEKEGETISKIYLSNWKLEFDNGTIIGEGYELQLKRLGEVLVTAPPSDFEKTNFKVSLPVNYSSKNTIIYAVCAEEKFATKMKGTTNEFEGVEVPNGKLVEMIVLSERDGKYFFDFQIFRMKTGIKLTSVPKERSFGYIEEVLGNI